MTTITEPRLAVDEEIERELGIFEHSASDATVGLRNMVERDALWTVAGMLRQSRRLTAEVERQKAYVSRLVSEVTRLNETKLRQIAFLEELIREYAEPLLIPGSKHVDIPGTGRVQYTDRKEAIRIEDHDAFIEALSADERARLVEQRPHLKTNEAKQYQAAVLETEGGALLPGAVLEPARRTAAIQYEEA